jgi:hypothetical protein
MAMRPLTTKSTIVCVLVLLLGAIGIGAKAKWKYAGTSQGNIVVFDTNSIKRRGSVVTVWEKWVPIGEAKRRRRAESISMPNFAYQMERSEYNCAKKQMRNVGTILYDTEGRILDSSGEDEADAWGDVVPDSIGEVIMDAVCRK